MQFGKIQTKESGINLGTRRTHIGAAPYPYTPLIKGDRWVEFDLNNDFVEEWFWNGTYWLSQAPYTIYAGTPGNGSSALQTTNLFNNFFVEQDFNVFILKYEVVFVVNLNSTASNFFRFQFGRSNSSSNTVLGTLDTINALSNVRESRSITNIGFINIVGLSVKSFFVDDFRIAGSLSRSSSQRIVYKKARL